MQLESMAFGFSIEDEIWRVYFERTNDDNWIVTADNSKMEKFNAGTFSNDAANETFCKTIITVLRNL